MLTTIAILGILFSSSLLILSSKFFVTRSSNSPVPDPLWDDIGINSDSLNPNSKNSFEFNEIFNVAGAGISLGAFTRNAEIRGNNIFDLVPVD